MTNIQPKETAQKAKPDLFAGIDVGAEELILVIRKNGKPFDPQKFTNTPADRTRLVKKLVKLPSIIVCLEATGVYHFDLSLALHDASVLLMVVNPKASHNFAKVLMKNSKTDAVDANTLAEYAARMDFIAWTRPSDEADRFA
jgi:transposase